MDLSIGERLSTDWGIFSSKLQWILEGRPGGGEAVGASVSRLKEEEEVKTGSSYSRASALIEEPTI